MSMDLRWVIYFCTILFSKLRHIDPGKAVFCFIYCSAVYDAHNDRLKAVFICLHMTMPHYHPSGDLSERIGPTNAWQIYSAGCVSKINCILTIIFYAIYGAVLFRLNNFSFADCDNIFTSSHFIIIYKTEIWIVGHCLGLGDDKNVMCHLFLIYPFVLVIVIYFEERVEGGCIF